MFKDKADKTLTFFQNCSFAGAWRPRGVQDLPQLAAALHGALGHPAGHRHLQGDHGALSYW